MKKINNYVEVVSSGEISDFELNNELILPESYRRHLLENNVCSVEPYGVSLTNFESQKSLKKPDAELGVLFGFCSKEDEEWSLQWNYDLYVNTGRVKKGYLPISSEGGGNLFVMELSTSKIYFWDHENEGGDNMIYLTTGIKSFIDGLVE
jgi:hypothetical protein